MKFSIVTVCRNAADVIAGAIESVAMQRYPDIEYLVIDGASTDGTREIVQAHARHVDRFVSEPDGGIYAAMNKGLRLARGEVVHFLNADDRLHDPDVLADVAAFLEQTDVDVAYGDILLALPGRSPVRVRYPPVPTRTFLGRRTLCHQALFARRRAFAAAGGFDERFTLVADYAWILRGIFDCRLRYAHLDRVVARVSGDGVSYRSDRLEAERLQAMAGYYSPLEIRLLRTWPRRLAPRLDRARWYLRRLRALLVPGPGGHP